MKNAQKAWFAGLARPAVAPSVKVGPRIVAGPLLRLCLCVSLLAVLGAAHALAQSSLGTIQGTVTDPKGAVVVGAQVNVLNNDTGVLIQTKTNTDGFYTVSSLVPGLNYDVTVIKTGFEELNLTAVSVQSSQTTTISGVLKVGEVTSTVTVTTEGQMLSKDSSAVTTNMDEELTDNLPYPEQGSLEVALLAPGVRGSQLDPSQLGSENPGIFIGAVTPGAQISINGATAGHSAILVDGADVTQSSYARAGITVSSGMAGQVTVISNGVPAQYGRTMGGVVITSTKSGTNEYHGRLQWRHTDPMFQAQPDGLPLPPGLHQNFFGAFFGGPIVIPHVYDGHNKTFFFAGFEPARFSNSTGSYNVVPLPEELQGDFYDDINLLNTSIVNSSGYQAAEAAARAYSIYYQTALNAQGFPIGPQLSSAAYTQVGAGMPPSTANMPGGLDNLSIQLAQNPFAMFLAQQLPSLTNPQETIFVRQDGYYNTCICASNGDNVFIKRTVKNVDNRWAFRIDHTISSSDRMYLRFSHTPLTANRTGLFSVSSPLNPWPSDTSNAYNVLIDETHVFTASLLNEFKVSYLRNAQLRTPPPASLTKDWAAAYGLTPSPAGRGFPNFTLDGDSVGTSQVSDNIDTSSLLQDDFTVVKGRHKLMVGVDLRRLQSNQNSNPDYYGAGYGFGAGSTAGPQSGATGVQLATIDLGLITGYTAQSVATTAHYRWQYYGIYVQDDYRILPKLTLNLGVRYEVETPRREINNLQGTFVPGISGSINGFAATGAFCFSGSCGLTRTIFPMNFHGVQPRIGIAWAPFDKFTVRSSYAILRVPLTGLSNTPLPNVGIAANSLTSTTGGVVNNQPVDYITNPIAAGTVSALSQLFLHSPNFIVPSSMAFPYIRQTNIVPYSQQWSFTLQYQLLRKTLVEMGYNGARGIHLFNNNQNPQNFPNMNTYFAEVNAGLNFQTGVHIPYSNSTLDGLQALLPYPQFYAQSAEINEIYNRDGVSSYHAMYVSVTHHFDRGLSLQGSFTWSKSIDNDGADSANLNAGSGFAAALQYPQDRAHEKSVSDYDVPATTRVGYTYQLPYGKRSAHMLPSDTRHGALNLVDNVLNSVLGDWSTGGIARLESSTPFLPTLGTHSTTGGSVGYWFSTGSPTYSILPVGINPRPNLVPGIPCINPLWSKSGGLKFGVTYINPQAFTIPGSTTYNGTAGDNFPAYGNAPRTMPNCRSPRQINFDMNASKTIPVRGHERMNFVLTITAINAFNHPLFFFNGSTTNDSTGNNGQIFTTYNTGVTAAPRNGVDNPAYPFSLPSGFNVATQFGTVNPGFTAQFSRVVQVGAAFNF